MRPLVRVGLGLALLAAAAAWWSADDVVLPASAPQRPASHEQRDAAHAPAPQREPVRTADATAGISRLPSSAITIEVLDAADQPVAGAIVECWDADSERRAPSEGDARGVVWLAPKRTAPIATLASDTDGRCVVEVERELAYVSARHAQFGRSIARAVGPLAGSEARVRLWLLRPVVVRGTVIDAAGAPVPYALVQCEGPRRLGKFAPETVTANAVGRFAFEAALGTACVLVASRHEQRSKPVALCVREDTDVLVAFAGAFSIRGRVADVSGRSIEGARIEVAGSDVSQPVAVTLSDADGSFVVLVHGCDRFRIDASIGPRATGERTKVHEVVVGLDDHQPFVDLVIGEPQLLRGIVVKYGGSPAGGLVLDVVETGARSWRVAVETDGTFTTQLSGASFATFSGPGLAPQVVSASTRGVRFVLEPEEPPLVIHGVVLEADGTPARIAGFELHWLSWSAAGEVGRFAPVNDLVRSGNTFRLSTPRRGADWWLVASPDNAAKPPGFVAPFANGVAEHVTIQIPHPATVLVRVLAGGQPVRGLDVTVSSAIGGRPKTHQTDEAGLATFDGRRPGPNEVVVMRGFEQLAARRLVLHPGPNTEIVIDVTL